MILTQKQLKLYQDIISKDIPNISALGSTQSGKTYDICLALIEYARLLSLYEENERKKDDYIEREYTGAIVGWTTDTIKSNIVGPLEKILQNTYHFEKGKDYELKYGNADKYLKIYGMKFYFFGFNTKLSFNKILGKPLIFVWVDESARIYTQDQLRESFDEIPGRMMSFAGHPYYKRIDSFNVEGNDNHPYKIKYIDNSKAVKYTFFPYDNPILDTPEKIKIAIESFPPGSLREQKVFNKWVVAEGRVFNKINKLDNLDNIIIKEIGIGIDYGSVNPTVFSPIALGYHQIMKKWVFVSLQNYYHNPEVEKDNPTTEYYSKQLRMFLLFLKDKYPNAPITDVVLDSEATHYSNRLVADRIPHILSKKGPGSVNSGIEYMQSLFYKDYLYVLKEPSIRGFNNNGEYIESENNKGITELEGYKYNKIKSEKEGYSCYYKENDHFVDCTRYLFQEWQRSGKAPTV